MIIFLKLLLSSGLIFIAVTAFIRNESLCYRPSSNIKPMHYDIKLTSYIKQHIFQGEYNISINILNKTKHIYLHSEKLCIDNIVIITNFKKYENDKGTVYKPTYNIEEDPIDISFMNELSPGDYILNIKYFGTADKGFRIFNPENETVWVGTPHFQIIGARQVFPCWHSNNLSLEATFNISLGCSNCTTLSNMPLRNTEIDEDNLLWTNYNTTPLMLTHHATMVVSNNLFPLGIKTQNIKMWCRVEIKYHMQFAKNVAKNITLFFQNKWKRWDNIWNVNHVAISNFHDKDITVFGLVLYRETDIMYNKNLCFIANKIEVAQLVGRKVTQQWFIDMMNDLSVSDFWFKKGLTTLLATYAVNKTYSDYQIINLYVVQNQHYSFNLDSYYMWSSTSQVKSSLEIPNSIRAPFVLRMMQHVLTDKIFQKGIRTYVYNLSHSDFVEVMRHSVPTTNEDILSQLTKMEDWSLEKHCPLINVERNYYDTLNQGHVRIQYNDTLKIRCISVTFTTQTFPDFNNFTHHMVCAKKHLKLSLPFEENGWIIFNIQQIGYYRVNYDEWNWQKISNYLNSDNYTKIHVLNRAQIIDDAFHLMITGKLTGVVFWNVIKYLHREEDYIAWYPMFKALEYLSSTFIVLKDEIENFTSEVRLILHEILKRIKYEEIDDTDKLRICLRQEAARWACYFDDITCKKEANDKLKQHLQDSAKHKLLPWWKEWTYCKGLMITDDENESTWELVYTKGLNKSDTTFLEYLACPKDTAVIIYYLENEQYHSIKGELLVNSFLHIITKHAKNPTILKYILDHFNEIKPISISITAAFIIIINNVYSVNQTEEINNYVEGVQVEANQFDGMNNAEDFYHIEKIFIKRISEKIKSQILIRNYQIERLRENFDSFFFWWKNF